MSYGTLRLSSGPRGARSVPEHPPGGEPGAAVPPPARARARSGRWQRSRAEGRDPTRDPPAPPLPSAPSGRRAQRSGGGRRPGAGAPPPGPHHVVRRGPMARRGAGPGAIAVRAQEAERARSCGRCGHGRHSAGGQRSLPGPGRARTAVTPRAAPTRRRRRQQEREEEENTIHAQPAAAAARGGRAGRGGDTAPPARRRLRTGPGPGPPLASPAPRPARTRRPPRDPRPGGAAPGRGRAAPGPPFLLFFSRPGGAGDASPPLAPEKGLPARGLSARGRVARSSAPAPASARPLPAAGPRGAEGPERGGRPGQ